MSEAIADYRKTVTYKPAERVTLLRSLSLAEQSAVLMSVSPYVQSQVLKELNNRELVDILDHLDLQSAQRLLARLKDPHRREKIVGALKADIKDKVEFFLRFHPKAGFSLVHFNYLFIPETTTVGEVGKLIDECYENTGKFPEILVHDGGVLSGEVPMGVLVREPNHLSLKKFVEPVTTISYQSEVGEIMDTFMATGKRKVVVLDQDQSVLGVVYSDDALELFSDLPSESLYSFVGVDSSERPLDGALRKFQNRRLWLMLNLATCVLASSVILLFQDTMNALTILSVYIPIVAGMGGNAASQTFAVMLRGITLGSISLKDASPIIVRELGAAFLNGILIGGFVAVVSILWGANPLLGAVVAVSMVGVHLVAGFFGALVPLLLKRFGFDPAATSMIFISTTTDVFGLLLLLGLGSWWLL